MRVQVEERSSGLMVAGNAQKEALPPQLSLTILLATRYTMEYAYSRNEWGSTVPSRK